MKYVDLIDMTRLSTFDTLPDQQTWKDSKYLMAFNEARAYLFSKCPESRVTAAVGLTDYALISETSLGSDMALDSIYVPFLVYYMAHKFFLAGSRDTVNLQKAQAQQAAFQQALAALGGR